MFFIFYFKKGGGAYLAGSSPFLQCVNIASYAESCISYDRFCLTICLSDRLLQAGIMPKRLQLRLCGLHWRIPLDYRFVTVNFETKFQKLFLGNGSSLPLAALEKYDGYINTKGRSIGSSHCCIQMIHESKLFFQINSNMSCLFYYFCICLHLYYKF